MGHREGVVRRDRPARLLVDPLEEREVDHPQEVQAALVDRRPAQLEPQQAEHVADHRPLVGDDQQQVAGLRRRAAPSTPLTSTSLRNLATGEETVAPSSTRIHTRPLAPKRLACSVSSSSCERLRPAPPGDAQALHARRPEGVEPGLGEQRGELHQLHPEAHVGLVAAEALLGLLPGHVGPERRRRSPVTTSAAAATASVTNPRTSSWVDEGGLEVELGELELAVGPEVLVTQAAGDLVVAVHARPPSTAA